MDMIHTYKAACIHNSYLGQCNGEIKQITKSIVDPEIGAISVDCCCYKWMLLILITNALHHYSN